MVKAHYCDGMVDMTIALAWVVTSQHTRLVVKPAVVEKVDVGGNWAVLQLGKNVLADRRRLPLVPPLVHGAPSCRVCHVLSFLVPAPLTMRLLVWVVVIGICPMFDSPVPVIGNVA